MAAAVLGDTLTPDNAHLHEGLRAVVRTGSAVAAAAHLEVHPQTVRYRLRRVHEITGRSTGDPWDLFVLSAAVLAAGS
nr:helix-turn-helix domain-containing protein [Nocardioides flavescens]